MSVFQQLLIILAVSFTSVGVILLGIRLALGLQVLPVISFNAFVAHISNFKIAPGEIMTVVAGLFWFARGGWKKLQTFRIPWFLIFGAMYIVTIGLSVIHAASYERVIREVIQQAMYFLLVPVLILTSISKVEAKQAIRSFAYIGLVVAYVSVVMWTAMGKPYILTTHLFDTSPIASSYREESIFAHYNVFGGAVALVLPIVFSLLLYFNEKSKRVLFTLFMVLLLLGLLASFSRGAMLGSLVALGVLVYLYPIGYLRSIYTGAVLGLCVLVATSFTANLPIPNTTMQRLFESAITGGEGRLVLWDAAIGMVKTNPVTGIGAGNFSVRVREFVDYQQDTAHNLYLNTAAETGLASVLLLLLTFGAVMVPLIRYLIVKKNDTLNSEFALIAGVLGSIIAFLMDNLATPLLVTGIAIPLFCLISYAHIIIRPEQ